MPIIYIGIAVIVALFCITWWRKKHKRNLSLFEIEQRELMTALNAVKATGEKGKTELLVTLFTWAMRSMMRLVPYFVSCYKGRKLTAEQKHYLAFESAVYLFFHFCVAAFNFGQTEDSRYSVEKLIWQNVLGSFISSDKTLETLIDERLDWYTRSYRNQTAMFNPPSLLLNHLKVLADSGTVNRKIALAPYGAFEHVIDWAMVQEMQSLYLFLNCFKALFQASSDFSKISFQQAKDLLLSTVHAATPIEFKREAESDQEKELLSAAH